MTRWLRLRMWLGRNLPPLLGALFGLALAFLFVSPLLLDLAQSLNLLGPNLQHQWFELLERVHGWSIQTLICAWVFALGSSIASFLNVVAYRMPRRRSILGRSNCPHCCQQIALWDNVPIFGWLRNGGRCRTCRLPIALRYLWVELILGATFLVIFLVDAGTVRTIQALQFARPEIAASAVGNLNLFFGHALLLSLIFVVALIQTERAPIPKRLVVSGWALSIAWFCVLLLLSTLLWSQASSLFLGVDWLGAGASLLAAFVLGAILPLGMQKGFDNRTQSLAVGETVAYGWIGFYLDWHVTLAASAVTAALILLARRTRIRIGQPFACVFMAVIFAILWDQWFGGLWIDLSARWWLIYAAGTTAAVIVLSLIARKIGDVCLAAIPPMDVLGSNSQSAEAAIDASRIVAGDQPTLRTEVNPPPTRID